MTDPVAGTFHVDGDGDMSEESLEAIVQMMRLAREQFSRPKQDPADTPGAADPEVHAVGPEGGERGGEHQV